jgi:hypothetical protein
MKTKKFAIAAALVLALTAIGSMPAIQTAAANLLQIFRVEQVDTLTMTREIYKRLNRPFMMAPAVLILKILAVYSQ